MTPSINFCMEWSSPPCFVTSADTVYINFCKSNYPWDQITSPIENMYKAGLKKFTENFNLRSALSIINIFFYRSPVHEINLKVTSYLVPLLLLLIATIQTS